MTRLILAAGLLPLTCASMFRQGTFSAVESQANPIRRVVTMLQKMQSKVTEEGKEHAELFDKFMCYCKTSGGDLSTSIQSAEDKIDALGAELKTALARKDQTASDLKEHTASRDDAKATMAQATALREKEAAAFAKFKSDSEANLQALSKAIPAIEKGAMGSFLQSPAAKIVRSLAMETAQLPDETRNGLLVFLSGTSSQGYAPQSGEIVGILKTIQDEMSKSFSDATEEETTAIANYEALISAKEKEVATLQKQIETEMTRLGQLESQIAEANNDVGDTQDSLVEDRKFKQELETGCQTKTAEWEANKKLRAEELLALADTIKVLNDDDALDLFKKSLPSPSVVLVQVDVDRKAVQKRALAELRRGTQASSSKPALDLISLVLQGKKIGFDQVIKMIDDLVLDLKAEQQSDGSKKVYCDSQFDESEDKQKVLENSITDSETAIAEMKGLLAELADEIAALEAGVKALDKSVAEATDLRQTENAEHKKLISDDTTAKDLLHFAKNRLNKFYAPKLYKPPPARDLTEEERLTINLGGTVPTAAPGGIADTGIGALIQTSRKQSRDAPAPPPATFGPYSSKTESGRGVIAMIDLLIADLDKDMQESTVDETNAQSEYETMMAESAAKRAADSKSITDKSVNKASTQEALESEEDNKAGTSTELMGTLKYISGLHGECDFLVKYFDARKQARADEVESLQNAKAVLNGANYA